MLPSLPQRADYKKRLRAALPLIQRLIRGLARDSIWRDTRLKRRLHDSAAGCRAPPPRRSTPTGWASYGYCASPSRFLRGQRRYLIYTPTGMPILWAPANLKLDEHEVLAATLEVDAELIVRREGILLITDQSFASKTFERELTESGITLPHPSFKREKQRYGGPMLTKARQLIESANDTLKVQLTGNNTAGVPSRALRSRWPSECWQWPPESGATTS
jgi:hypothetical protein